MMRYLLIALITLGVALVYARDPQDQHNGRSGDGRDGSPKVYDAQGKYVGQLETNSSADGVFLTMNGAVTFVSIERVFVGTQRSATQFQWASAGYIEYLSADCSGPPILQYLNASGLPYVMGPRPSMAVRQGSDVVLYVAGDATSTNVNVQSHSQASQCQHYGVVMERQAVFLPDTTYPLTQMYPEPLSIRY